MKNVKNFEGFTNGDAISEDSKYDIKSSGLDGQISNNIVNSKKSLSEFSQQLNQLLETVENLETSSGNDPVYKKLAKDVFEIRQMIDKQISSKFKAVSKQIINLL